MTHKSAIAKTIILLTITLLSACAMRGFALTPVTCDTLAFRKERGVYLAKPDGSGSVRLAYVPGKATPKDIRWSPDGRWLGYSTYFPSQTTSKWALHIVSADGKIHKQLTSDQDWRWRWRWSPDSQYIDIYGSTSTVYSHAIIHRETGELVCRSIIGAGHYSDFYQPMDCDPVELSDGTLWYLRGYKIPIHEEFYVYAHRLSPDKKWVILWTEHLDSKQRSWQIAQVNGEDLRPIVDIPGDERSPHIAWHPDSQHFAFVTSRDNRDYIWTTQKSNEDVLLLTELPEASCPRLLWSASGQYIYCGQYVIEWPGGQVDTLPASQSGYEELTWSPEGDYLLIKSSGLFIWDAGARVQIELDAEFEECEWSPSGLWLDCHDKSSVTVLELLSDDRVDVEAKSSEHQSHWWYTTWSPSGRWLAISSRSWERGIWVFDTDSSKIIQVSGSGDWPVWSPPCE